MIFISLIFMRKSGFPIWKWQLQVHVVLKIKIKKCKSFVLHPTSSNTRKFVVCWTFLILQIVCSLPWIFCFCFFFFYLGLHWMQIKKKSAIRKNYTCTWYCRCFLWPEYNGTKNNNSIHFAYWIRKVLDGVKRRLFFTTSWCVIDAWHFTGRVETN